MDEDQQSHMTFASNPRLKTKSAMPPFCDDDLHDHPIVDQQGPKSLPCNSFTFLLQPARSAAKTSGDDQWPHIPHHCLGTNLLAPPMPLPPIDAATNTLVAKPSEAHPRLPMLFTSIVRPANEAKPDSSLPPANSCAIALALLERTATAEALATI